MSMIKRIEVNKSNFHLLYINKKILNYGGHSLQKKELFYYYSSFRDAFQPVILLSLVTSVLAYYFKHLNLFCFATFDDLTFNRVSPTHSGFLVGGGTFE